MIRTQVYLTDDLARDIKLRGRQEHKPEAQVIREAVEKGLTTTRETAGESLLRLAGIHAKGPSDASARIDDYLYGDDSR